MNIIGISGLAGSGKDTVADFLLKHEGFVKMSLADPIKRFAMDVWEFSEEQLWGPSKNRNSPDYRYPLGNDNFLTPRLVLQHLGTEGARAIDDNVWIRCAIRTATRLLEAKPREYCYSQTGGLETYIENYPQGEFERDENFPEKVKAVIIPDVRFKNEVQHIKAAGGKIIRVLRPGAGLAGNFALHQSEIEMSEIQDSEFDVVINNVGTLSDLKNLVDDYVSNL
jgi:hypothetical protein